MEANERDEPISAGWTLDDLGKSLTALGKELSELGAAAVVSEAWDPRREMWLDSIDEIDRLVEEGREAQKRADAMIHTLNGLRKFRAEYERLERLIASYAMHKMEFSQRRTATLLGVGLGTVNRISQAVLQEDE